MNAILTRDDNHIYRMDGKIVPGVNQILAFAGLLPDYSGINEAVMKYSKQRGLATEQSVYLWHDGVLDESSIDDAIKGYFASYMAFISDFKPILIAKQGMKYSELGFAGEFDLMLKIDGKSTVTDLKCTSKLYDSVRYQLAGYQILTDAEQRAAILLKKDGKYQFKEYKDPEDELIFLNALSIYQKLNSQH